MFFLKKENNSDGGKKRFLVERLFNKINSRFAPNVPYILFFNRPNSNYSTQNSAVRWKEN